MTGREGAGPIVAIDGPAGSGKSTVARLVAERLGLAHLDTGAMYRSVAWAVLRAGADPADAASVTAIAEGLTLELDPGAAAGVRANGVEVTEAIRGPEVSAVVSVVAAHPGVRRTMVERQRAWVADRQGAVVEGRDIGTVVFPHARPKIYLTASDTERARRRAGQDVGMGQAQAAADIATRDRIDSTRAASPLQVAADAVVIDTTDRGIDAVVQEVLACL